MERGGPELAAMLETVCDSQLLRYGEYIDAIESVFPRPIVRPKREQSIVKKLLMWLTTPSSETVPRNMPYSKGVHDVSIWARPPRDKRV